MSLGYDFELGSYNVRWHNEEQLVTLNLHDAAIHDE